MGQQLPQMHPQRHRTPGMNPMASAILLLLLLLGTGAQLTFTETTETTEMTTTDTTTTETTTTDTTTTETTAKTTVRTFPVTVTTAGTIMISKNASRNETNSSISSHATIFPTTGNETQFQTHNRGTTEPVAPHPNTTSNNSSMAPTSAGSTTTVVLISGTQGNRSSSTLVVPTQRTPAPRQTPTAVLGSSSNGPDPSEAAVLPPSAIQLLLRVPLSFRILNRSFNDSLRDPSSKEYQSLQYTLLTMFQRVFGCRSCMGRLTYKGCSELQFSQGSVAVQSTLMFSNGNINSDAAAQQLRKSLDPNGFIMGLQLDSIQSSVEVTPPAPVPVVPDWAIALLVLVCILLLLSILTCLLMTTCTCHRKSRGKLDLFSTKDSYHPMAEYPPYQSHGRYVSPNSKPKPYSQVPGSNGTGTGTFTYTNTNPAAASDNL